MVLVLDMLYNGHSPLVSSALHHLHDCRHTNLCPPCSLRHVTAIASAVAAVTTVSRGVTGWSRRRSRCGRRVMILQMTASTQVASGGRSSRAPCLQAGYNFCLIKAKKLDIYQPSPLYHSRPPRDPAGIRHWIRSTMWERFQLFFISFTPRQSYPLRLAPVLA